MDTTQITPAPVATSHAHPLVLVAAASVTVLSLAGVGVLAGWLPGPASHGAEPAKVATAAPQAPARAPISIQQTVTVPQEKPKAAAKPVERAPLAARRTESAPIQSPPPAILASAPAAAASPAPTYANSTYVAAPQPPVWHTGDSVRLQNGLLTMGGGRSSGPLGTI